MTVRQIIALCKRMLNFACDGVETNAAATEEQDKTDAELADCFNFVMEELYCDYATAIGKTVVSASNGYIDVSKLNLNKVLSLTDSYGDNVAFRYTENGLYVRKDGEYNLAYAKKPPEYGFDDEVTMPSPRITYRIAAYGILAEYCQAAGDCDAALEWRTKYIDALKAREIKPSGQYLPKRRWL